MEQNRIEPTKVRLDRGEVKRDPIQVPDVRGAIGNPYRVETTLAAMRRRGTIDADMLLAGVNFHCQFVVAQLHALRAADMGRTMVEGGKRTSEMPRRIYDARDWVWQALITMGGLASPCGSIAWGVLGEEWSIDKWATGKGWGGKPMKRETASGLLIGALGVLVSVPAPETI
jgi:hypothetical protein